MSRYPEWWTLGLSAAAWVAMLQPHAHHRAPLLQWLLMTVAMMFPVMLDSIRATAERSLWKRRNRAIAGFLLGYLACWMLAGAILIAIRIPAEPRFAAAALLIAAAWQCTRAKRIALTGCHATMPLAPRGWRADRDCIRYGWLLGTRCVVSCWALMLACFLTGHALAAMIALTAIVVLERLTPIGRAVVF